ncbi:MAG: metallophosphatase family protein [Candidatus Omnitrophica bacterium]|nr:metallophosphatase family protein [Candidatus Omnitrophota bacterium]
MRSAILADIHGNWEALQVAVTDALRHGIDRWVVLGDTVGYGADPNACFEWVLKNAGVHLMGNHDQAVIDPALRDWFNDDAREAIVWTQKVLIPSYQEEIRYLPYLRIEKKATYAHASPDRPKDFRYLLDWTEAESSFRAFENSVCFIGHTHVPCCFYQNKRRVEHLGPGILRLEEGERYILNPGSVGQPRDRDPRLAFGIYDEEKETFEIIRLPYDNEKAARKIRQAGLPHYLAERLL